MSFGNMKEVKRRIKSVESIMRITGAMEMVSSSKLRKAKGRWMEAHRFFEEYRLFVQDMCAIEEPLTSPYIQKEEPKVGKPALYIVVAGDRGFSGAYNYNVLKLALQESGNQKTTFLTIGKKAAQFFRSHELPVEASYDGISETLSFDDALAIAERARALYQAGEIEEVKVFFTRFHSPLLQVAEDSRLLPIQQTHPATHEYIAREPGVNELINAVVPQFMAHAIYTAVLEAFVSEQAASHLAMEAATKSADDMLEELFFQYNRARQTAITQEITEIVAGANIG